MNTKIFGKVLGGVALVSMTLASCSSDYLDTKPITSVSTNVITSNLTSAKSTYYGVIEGMYTQYGLDEGMMILNGESWNTMYYGELSGQDFISWLWPSTSIGTYITNWDGMNQGTYWMPQSGWAYCYSLINYCNGFLSHIDEMVGTDAEKKVAKYYKAGVLAVRAHAYTRLLQIYAPRWEDSNNGEAKCVPIRLVQSTEDLPLSSMNEVLAQIYADLDASIEIFQESGTNRDPNYIWEPNIDVARGLYARAAMLKHDYVTAQKMAHDARQNYPIMSADQYKDGFAIANQEYMWSNINDSFVYYWAHGSVYACNGAYPIKWQNIGAGAIDLTLFRAIPEGDIRRDLYFTPDQDFVLCFPEDFYDPEYVVESNLDVNYRSADIISELKYFSKINRPSWWDAIRDADPNSIYDAYTDNGSSSESHIYVPLGAQFKFWGQDIYGTNQFPYMRGAEMLFTEAEAAYHNGDEATAKNCLVEINSLRQSHYSCTASGSALLDEIRLYRRMELWGEGMSWYDLKRWNIPMQRKAWVAGDDTSGNWPRAYAITKDVDANYGWTYAIPQAEYQYNSLIRQDENLKQVETRKPTYQLGGLKQ